MAFIDEIVTAINNYETDNCRTEIVNFSITGGGGSVLNVNETFQFQIRVTNQSHLDMKNVRMQAIGTSFADVASGLFGPFSGSALSLGAFNLDAHQSHTTEFFRGRAKAVTEGPRDIVSARIFSWDASLDHILNDLSGAGVAEGKLNKDVLPD